MFYFPNNVKNQLFKDIQAFTLKMFLWYNSVKDRYVLSFELKRPGIEEKDFESAKYIFRR